MAQQDQRRFRHSVDVPIRVSLRNEEREVPIRSFCAASISRLEFRLKGG